MRNFMVTTALLLCSLRSESQIVEVQPGKDVTLLCPKLSSIPSQITWFKLVNRTVPRSVFPILHPSKPAPVTDGFQNGRFEMSSNISTISLEIKDADLLDSGLYFCGYCIGRRSVIVSATYLEVQEVSKGKTDVGTVILAILIVFLGTAVIFLAVKIRKLQRAHVGEQNLQQTEGWGSDEMNYASVTFRPANTSNHKSASVAQVEQQAIYSATR